MLRSFKKSINGLDVLVWEKPMAYEAVLRRMNQTVLDVSQGATEQVWVLEHAPIYTLGTSTQPQDIPHSVGCVRVSRGGRITYHGPGQTMVYIMLDLRRRGWTLGDFLQRLERFLIGLAEDLGVLARYDQGLWVGERKLASVGVRVSRGVTSHGCALYTNRVGLKGFERVNPCGVASPLACFSDFGPTDGFLEMLYKGFFAHF